MDEGDLDVAQQEFRAVLATEPKYLPARLSLAEVLFKSGQEENAAKAYAAVLEIDATNPEASIGLARIELQRGEATQAIERLGNALEKGPGRPDLRAELALAFVQRNADGDLTRALADSDRALKAAPKDPDVLYTRGSVLTAAHKFEDAQAALDQLERASPRSALAPYGLARLAAAQGRKTDVMLHLRAARAASGALWQPEPVAADPAFAFLKEDPDFTREVSGR
jgi:Tfp pilus assembly protein PilF